MEAVVHPFPFCLSFAGWLLHCLLSRCHWLSSSRCTTSFPVAAASCSLHLSSHSPLVHWLVVVSMPPPLVLATSDPRMRCHPQPSRQCPHHSPADVLPPTPPPMARASEGATVAPPMTKRCRLRPADAPPPLPQQHCTPIAPPLQGAITDIPQTLQKRWRASVGGLLLYLIVVSVSPSLPPLPCCCLAVGRSPICLPVL